jgi:hypothetical protein
LVDGIKKENRSKGCNNLRRMEVSKDNVRSLNDALPSPKLDPRWALIFKTAEL